MSGEHMIYNGEPCDEQDALEEIGAAYSGFHVLLLMAVMVAGLVSVGIWAR